MSREKENRTIRLVSNRMSVAYLHDGKLQDDHLRLFGQDGNISALGGKETPSCYSDGGWFRGNNQAGTGYAYRALSLKNVKPLKRRNNETLKQIIHPQIERL